MSAGALTQLVAYGAQDVYLTGEPKFTYFKSMYRQHSNFAMETIKQIVDGSAVPGQTLTVTVGRHGDLVGETFIQLKPKSGLFRTSNNTNLDTCWIAERAFTSVELQINGQMVDKHYQTWWRIYSELFMDTEKKANYEKMISSSGVYSESSVVYLPLIFFFNKDPGQYLPLIALQMSEVKILLECSNDYSNYFESTPIIWSNYIFLDAQERNKFATNTLEYLIEQVQYNGGPSVDSGITETSQATTRLTFSHPVKALTWVFSTPLNPNNRNALWNFTSNCSNVNVTCNPLLFESGSTHVLPDHFGVPHVAQGPNSMFFTDCDYSDVAPPATPIQTIVAQGSPATLTGTVTPTITLSTSANILPGDVVAIVANSALTINGVTGTALNHNLFVVRTFNATGGAVTLSQTWSPNMSTTPSVTISATGTATVAVYRMTGVTSVLANTSASVAQGQNVTLASTQGILPGSILLFSINTTSGPQAGTPYYVSSVLNATTVQVSTTWPTVTPANFTNASGALHAATIDVDVFSYFNVPVTNAMIEAGPPHLGVEVGPLHKFQILLNGKFRFTEQYGKYFNQVQPFHHFKGVPYPGIYSYSFALHPCELSPSGTCNFSRIDIPQAQYWLKTMSTPSNALQFKVFAISYNVFKIQSGLGGIMFSN
jgi:hypothetical protein